RFGAMRGVFGEAEDRGMAGCGRVGCGGVDTLVERSGLLREQFGAEADGDPDVRAVFGAGANPGRRFYGIGFGAAIGAETSGGADGGGGGAVAGSAGCADAVWTARPGVSGAVLFERIAGFGIVLVDLAADGSGERVFADLRER